MDNVYGLSKNWMKRQYLKGVLNFWRRLLKVTGLISGLSFSPWLGIVLIAKNGSLYLPENTAKVMQLVLLMHEQGKVKLKTEDLGLTSVNFNVVEQVWTVFLPWGNWCVLFAEESVSQESKTIT